MIAVDASVLANALADDGRLGDVPVRISHAKRRVRSSATARVAAQVTKPLLDPIHRGDKAIDFGGPDGSERLPSTIDLGKPHPGPTTGETPR